MRLLDSRRLTGVNIVSALPGAVLDVAFDEDADADATIVAWEENARAALDAIGWRDQTTHVRRFRGGASLQISAPIDGWYAACEINEWAWEATTAAVGEGDASPLEQAAVRLRELVAQESNPRLMALRAAAAARGVTVLADDERASVGLGSGSRTWPVDEIPGPAELAWESVHDIPVVLITGTNGKTTTARMLARMVGASGATPGNTSTDGVQVGGKIILAGDYTGGEGARALLQDRRVDYAILETARGGLLRRGLPIGRAQAALVTNVGPDHLGEFGVADLDELADAKMLVARAIGESGTLVLNADDPALVARSPGMGAAGRGSAPDSGRLVWLSLDPSNPVVLQHTAAGGEALYARDGNLVRHRAGGAEVLIGIDDIPITLNGAARHNVSNALGAAALGFALGLECRAIVRGLGEMQGTLADNPGRGNLFEVEGARAYVDFAHNPPGVAAIIEMAARVPAQRRLIVIGQAGDRDDESIRALARAAWQPVIDHVIVKEMPRYYRGREPGEVPRLITEELRRLGAPAGALEVVGSELAAVRRAVAWSRPGDLLLLLLQERDEGLRWLQEVGTPGWGEATTGRA